MPVDYSPHCIFPLSQHLQTGAEFPDNSFTGRICQEESLESFLGSENNTFIGNLRQRFLTLVGKLHFESKHLLMTMIAVY